MLELPIKEYLTFDDVLLVPGRSGVLPGSALLQTRFTRGLSLNIPFVSAPMDTVTESRLAIALAQEGGIGIIHKNLSIERQAEEVDRVKRYSSGMIMVPITLSPDQTIKDAADLMQRYNVSGIPITDGGKLVGIVTKRDLLFETDISIQLSLAMTKNPVTAPVGTSLEEAQEILRKHRIEKLPVVEKDNTLKGLITIKDILKNIQFPDSAKDGGGHLLVGAAVGVGEDRDERAEALVKARVDVLVIDTAHGHSEGVIRSLEILRKKYPDISIVAGNIATRQAARDLIDAGADALKVGIGPGSICTTRMISGVGVPQISAVAECAQEAKKDGVPVIADGGIKYSGDVVKALAAGADAVMIGSIFAGVEESPGAKVLYQGRAYKEYRGMGSIGAMQEGGAERYFKARDLPESKMVPEGVEGRVPYKGSLSFTARQLVGGLRSGMGYCGTATIKELKEKSQFIRITSAGLRESHVHDVIITREAPNYGMD